MANTKISALTAATTPVAGTEVLPIVQSSTTKQLSIANLTPGLSTITAAKGGTGQTVYAVGDLLYADTTTTLAKLADVATGNALISGGVTTAPSWGKIGLTTHVSGTLPVANGGTGVTSLTAGYIPFGAGTSAFGSSANLFWDNTNARLGIGTSSPGYKLDVNGAVSVSGITSGTGNKIYFDTTGAAGANTIGTVNDYDLRLECGRGSTSQIYVSTDSLKFYVAGSERMRIASGGIVTMSAYGAGAATFSAAGVISSVSDETWKIKDGVPIDPDSMLKKLEPGYWYYNDEKKEIFGVDRQLGFYAQNVNAAIGPEAAPTPEEGKPWGYYDRSVLAVAVMSLQKALATIESLTSRIEALEAR